ncbi:alpha/beta hydrolase [Myroides sp. BIT-d1]|uniref:Alpha/beta hydrolase n=1 Tax=Myroides albus TaxID=2562892 RepID=A0A6I3LM06_9FLAO|nr:lipase family protein [Myroides albus]MTG99403.1 alpha/beta hydrolase [Myroides albus]
MKRKNLLIAMFCLTTLSIPLFTACNNDDSNKSIIITDPVIKTYIKEEAYAIDKLDEASQITIMTYTMPNVLSQPTQATALIFYPKTEKPKDGWRVVVWAHGTVGVGDACAPSNNMIGANFKVMAKSLLEEGYIIVAPDYEGLGTKGIHPYLNLKSEALSSIYAIHAIKEQYKDELQGGWMSAGQSQGGQASLGVAEFANDDPFFKGAVAGAPASSLGEIILEVAPKALAQIEQLEIKNNVPLDKRNSVGSYATLLSYAGLAGAGIKAYEQEFDYTNLFEERAKDLALLSEGNNGECLDEIRSAFKDDIINVSSI